MMMMILDASATARETETRPRATSCWWLAYQDMNDPMEKYVGCRSAIACCEFMKYAVHGLLPIHIMMIQMMMILEASATTRETETDQAASRTEAETHETDGQTEAKTKTRRGAGREKDIVREEKPETVNLTETAKEI
jgi:hypothetical protein